MLIACHLRLADPADAYYVPQFNYSRHCAQCSCHVVLFAPHTLSFSRSPTSAGTWNSFGYSSGIILGFTTSPPLPWRLIRLLMCILLLYSSFCCRCHAWLSSLHNITTPFAFIIGLVHVQWPLLVLLRRLRLWHLRLLVASMPGSPSRRS